LKKYLKFITQKPKSIAQAVSMNKGKAAPFLKTLFFGFKRAFLSYTFFCNNNFIPKINLA